MPKRISRYRRRFGQVFLRDPLVIERIVQSACLDAHDIVLEIGPGRGALTFPLARHAMSLYAIEIEAHYAQELQQRFANVPHVHIMQADASTYDYMQLPTPLVVVANLPYSTGIRILRHLFGFRQRLSRLLVMLQKEVAERLLAVPGASAYSGSSVFFQYCAAMQPCFDVSCHAFSPRPAVDSTVLLLQPYTSLPWPSDDERFLFWLVKCAFAHRRKTLRKNLLAAPHLRTRGAAVAEILTTLGIDSKARAQELPVSQFVQLAASLRRLLPCQHASGKIEP